MTRLALRRGTVVAVDGTSVTVEVDGTQRPALSFEDMTGPVEPGDEVVVNVAAVELGLGSGGFDVVHANLTRGLAGSGLDGAHVMKLNYTSLQHAVIPVEELTGEGRAAERGSPAAHPAGGSAAPTGSGSAAPTGSDSAPPTGSGSAAPLAGGSAASGGSGWAPPTVGGKPVAVIALHGQLPCVAWAAAQTRPGARIGYVQTAGGALPGELSKVVKQLRDRDLLAGHVAAGPAFGGEHDAITTAGGIHAGLTALGWDAAIVGPGPGILGSATALGHGGLAALDNAHAALALQARTIVVPRMSSADPRPRHRGLSHHTRTVLDLMLKPALVAWPAGTEPPQPAIDSHELATAAADLDGYLASGLPARTMGRSADEDPLFFNASLAGGTVLGEQIE